MKPVRNRYFVVHMRKTNLLLTLLFAVSIPMVHAQDTTVSQLSPDKQLRFTIRFQHDKLSYSVSFKGHDIIGWSSLGLVTTAGDLPAAGDRVRHVLRSAKDETFPWLFGENKTIRNHYNELTLGLGRSGHRNFTVVTRVFNNNIAFQYRCKVNGETKIIGEATSWNLLQPFDAWRHNTESVIQQVKVGDMSPASDIPLVLSAPGLYIALNEAKNTNYTKALIGRGAEDNSLGILFIKDTAVFHSSFETPWRTITIAETATALADNSDLLYKLNDRPDPSRDYSWVKPGKLMRDMTLTTAGAVACIDFAREMNFQYVMYDAGWYGKGYYAEFDRSSDPDHVVADIDMAKVISYGKSKGIGLILYVNYVGLRKNNLDTLYSLYRRWGVTGLKFGFVNGLTQDGIHWLMGAVRKAQDYGLIVDVHDNYKPTGISRTYPAWLTQEGVRGNENDPDALHNTTLPFTRLLSGPADYTFCYRSQNDSFNNTMLSKKLQVSQAQQLALTVLFYSPLQSMLWYGRPSWYTQPEQTEFFKWVPTTWDRTVHIAGEIGRYAVTAREKDGEWFIGAAANEKYSQPVRLDFLPAGKTFIASIYTDDEKGGVQKKVIELTKDSALPLLLGKGEGMAVKLKIKN